MWNIYNKRYDLTPFLYQHPGGSDILIKTKGEKDITVLFETYHAFSNKKGIKQSLQKYELTNDNDKKGEIIYKAYDFTNYDQLCFEIKKIYKTRNSIKSTWFSCSLNSLLFLLYVFYFHCAVISHYHVFFKCIYAFVAGGFYISLGFTVMHDASHYAVSVNPNINLFLTKLWNGWGLWNANMWFFHHVLNHHSFTGQENQDPDLYHYRPFARKVKTDYKIYSFFLSVQDKLLPFILFVFPGQYIGQSISYVISSFKQRLFKIDIPKIAFYDIIDLLLGFTHILFLYYGGFWPCLCYALSLNFWYAINIIPDHDTYETSIDNHYIGKDWCKMQICNSGNFLNNSLLWTYLFGGINYQIEHHLFPNMSYIHYPTISPIVKKYCKENNIPYVHHETVYDAYLSFIKMLKYNIE
jgi:fatty acid desaturase